MSAKTATAMFGGCSVVAHGGRFGSGGELTARTGIPLLASALSTCKNECLNRYGYGCGLHN
jgi:hypothetical protein